MRIYDYLFYHIYELALRSESNREMPMFIVVPVISLCIMFNIFTLYFLFEGLGILNSIPYNKEYRFLGTSVLLILVTIYYLPKRRYKTIYDNFVRNRKSPPKLVYSILVVIVYYVLSFTLLLIAGMYKNQAWIFAT